MSKPSDRRPGRPVEATRLAALLAVTLATTLLAGTPAQAAASIEDNRSAFDAAAAIGAAPPAPPARPRYLLRCWQEGQIVIEESGLELPLEGPAAAPGGPAGSVRLRATGRDRQPIYLTETRNATCLVRPQRDEARTGR